MYLIGGSKPHIVEIRNYDACLVSDKFAVGECIEWIEDEWDLHECHYIQFRRGTIKQLGQRVITLEENRLDGTTTYCRTEIFYLESWIRNPVLKASLKTWVAEQIAINKARRQAVKHTTRKRRDALYCIYTLTDPRNGDVRYVGASSQPEQRYRQHLACSDGNFLKNTWVQELLSLELSPVFTIVESDVLGWERADQRESYWMQHYNENGTSLLNITKNIVYHNVYADLAI